MVQCGAALEPNSGPLGSALDRINQKMNDIEKTLSRLRRALEIGEHTSAAYALMASVEQPSTFEDQLRTLALFALTVTIRSDEFRLQLHDQIFRPEIAL